MNLADCLQGPQLATLAVEPLDSRQARALVAEHHYLHRRPPVSHAYGLWQRGQLAGAITFGTPASRHMQLGAHPDAPHLVTELNRLWVSDVLPRNTESWFVARALRLLPGRIVLSYADTAHGHLGYVYRACNFWYAGWTDMERPKPRLDYLPADPATHTRDAFRGGYERTVRRRPKVKYWTVTGTRTERRQLQAVCRWPRLDWDRYPPPRDGHRQLRHFVQVGEAEGLDGRPGPEQLADLLRLRS